MKGEGVSQGQLFGYPIKFVDRLPGVPRFKPGDEPITFGSFDAAYMAPVGWRQLEDGTWELDIDPGGRYRVSLVGFA